MKKIRCHSKRKARSKARLSKAQIRQRREAGSSRSRKKIAAATRTIMRYNRNCR